MLLFLIGCLPFLEKETEEDTGSTEDIEDTDTEDTEDTSDTEDTTDTEDTNDTEDTSDTGDTGEWDTGEVYPDPPFFTSEAAITPNTGVYTGTILTCSAAAEDSDDGVIEPIFSWTVDGLLIGYGASYTVNAAYTNVGDQITCMAEAIDSQGFSVISTSSVTLENTAPTISNVTISPTQVTDTTLATCSATAYDPDEEVDIYYTWESDGVILSTQQSFDLALSFVFEGDILHCRAETIDSQGELAEGTASVTVTNP